MLDDTWNSLAAWQLHNIERIAYRSYKKGKKDALSKSKESKEKCRWVVDEDGIWSSSCGASWNFENGGLKENNVKFCHSCGKLISKQKT